MIIALDLDGTLVPKGEEHVPHEVIHALEEYFKEGWQFVFITGRPYGWAQRALSHLPFSYFLAVQNGSIIVEMPTKKVIATHYLGREVLPAMEEICSAYSTDFVVCAGLEFGDGSYYRSDRFPPEMQRYLHERMLSYDEIWHKVQSFNELAFDGFASFKCFGGHDSMRAIGDRIEAELGLHAPHIRDPYCSDVYVTQATDARVSKGNTLAYFKRELKSERVIAAGDDNNDKSMLDVADVSVVMETAPREMLDRADVIAPAASKMGIIQGLAQAIRRC